VDDERRTGYANAYAELMRGQLDEGDLFDVRMSIELGYAEVMQENMPSPVWKPAP